MSDAPDPQDFQFTTPITASVAGLVGAAGLIGGGAAMLARGSGSGNLAVAGIVAGLVIGGVSGVVLGASVSGQSDRQRRDAAGPVLDAWDGQAALPEWMSSEDAVIGILGKDAFAFRETIGAEYNTAEDAAAAANAVAESTHDRRELEGFAEMAGRYHHDTDSMDDVIMAAAQSPRSVDDSLLILDLVREAKGRDGGDVAAKLIGSDLPTEQAVLLD